MERCPECGERLLVVARRDRGARGRRALGGRNASPLEVGIVFVLVMLVAALGLRHIEVAPWAFGPALLLMGVSLVGLWLADRLQPEMPRASQLVIVISIAAVCGAIFVAVGR